MASATMCILILFGPQDQDETPAGSAQASTVEGNSSSMPDIFSSMLKDTTSEHRTHLFDLNCKICTGKCNKVKCWLFSIFKKNLK